MRLRVALLTAFVLLAGCAEKTTTTSKQHGSASVNVTLPKAQPAYAKHVEVAAALTRFADCTAVTRTLRADALRYVGPYGLAGAGGGAVYALKSGAAEDTATNGAAASAPQAAVPQAGVDYSTTNVQEQGVDEPDLVETDGERIFAVANGTLHAAVITNDTPRLVGAFHLASSDGQLLLDGNRLVVVGSDIQSGPQPVEPMRGGVAMSMPMAYSERTLVQVIDVSDPAHMTVESTLHLDGNYVAARSVKGIVRIVVRRSSPNIAFATPNDGTPQTTQRALDTNKDIIRKAGIDKWIPRFTLNKGKAVSSGSLSSCSTTYAPPVFSGFSTVTVVTIDPANPTPTDGSTVVGGGEIVYASPDNLYITAQKWDAPVPYVVSSGGNAVSRPVAPDIQPSNPETQIHMFSIKGPSATYIASGIVKGTLLNSYAMSEFDGNLRVATTSQIFSPTSSSSSSAVTIFAPSGKALVPVGSVGGLGNGEQIRAVRFMGPVGYVVTFQQIDPLYTLDLSKPNAPKIAGELKMPGFSAYLHPVGDGLLLGVGEVATAEGRVHDDQGHWYGTKISLFDVSDPAHAKEIATHVISGGQSAVENEPHAFLWWAPRKLAVVPISSYDAQSFRGAVGMNVDKTITEVGRISDPDTSSQDYYDPGVQRAFVVGDRLYTLSLTGIRSSDITNFTQKTWLPFGS